MTKLKVKMKLVSNVTTNNDYSVLCYLTAYPELFEQENEKLSSVAILSTLYLSTCAPTEIDKCPCLNS